jgi:photosystem II stability/assembly factor-like uncharacterized protein
MSDTVSYLYAGAATSIFTAQSGVTARGGMYRRRVADGDWHAIEKGLPEHPNVHVIAVHPDDREVVYIGTDHAVYRSVDRGERWERLEFANGAHEVWSILFDPRDPRTVYAGAAPAAVYRSRDGGETWQRLPFDPPERCRAPFPTRVMRLASDPSRPDDLYAGLEIGGVMRSTDGGETWIDASDPLVALAGRPRLKSRIVSDTETEGMLDAHALCVSSATPGTVYLALRMGLFRSVDRGATWDDMEVGRFSPLTYARDVRVSPHDPRVLYACLSPAARSEDGSLYRSADLGQTWTRFDRGVTARSTMMTVALDPRDAACVACATRHGQVFSTVDAGATWKESPLPDGVQDVYALGCA